MQDDYIAARLDGLALAHREAGERRASSEALLRRILSEGGLDPAEVLGDLDAARSSPGLPDWVAMCLDDLSLEQSVAHSAAVLLEGHTTWPWLSRLSGLPAARLMYVIPRLAVEESGRPSAFFAACGLECVAGDAYRCDRCGLQHSVPVGRVVYPRHTRRGGKGTCDGVLALQTRVRVSKPLLHDTEADRRTFEARCAVREIAHGLVAAGGPFAEYLNWQIQRSQAAQPDYTAARIRRVALRRVEMLFLAQLWSVWRAARGLPIRSRPSGSLPVRFHDPWRMVQEDVGPTAVPAGESDAGPNRPRAARVCRVA